VGVPLDVEVPGGSLPGLLHRAPADVEALAPCVLATDIYGTVPFYREVAARLAAAGATTLLVDLFFREGPLPEVTREAAYARRARMDEAGAIDDTEAAVAHLATALDAPRVGVVGFCLGGLIAMVLAARRDDVLALSFYGFPEGLAGDVRVRAPRPLDLAGEVRSPIVAFWGDQDHLVPADVVERYGRALLDAGAPYESHRYADAGHGFLQGLVEDRADSGAARDAWGRVLDHLSAIRKEPA
jgi:carboxymethylenebutenolidase